MTVRHDSFSRPGHLRKRQCNSESDQPFRKRRKGEDGALIRQDGTVESVRRSKILEEETLKEEQDENRYFRTCKDSETPLSTSYSLGTCDENATRAPDQSGETTSVGQGPPKRRRRPLKPPKRASAGSVPIWDDPKDMWYHHVDQLSL